MLTFSNGDDRHHSSKIDMISHTNATALLTKRIKEHGNSVKIGISQHKTHLGPLWIENGGKRHWGFKNLRSCQDVENSPAGMEVDSKSTWCKTFLITFKYFYLRHRIKSMKVGCTTCGPGLNNISLIASFRTNLCKKVPLIRTQCRDISTQDLPPEAS